MARQDKPKRQVCGVPDSDSNGDEWVLNGTTVVTHLKRRAGNCEIKAVMFGPREVQSLAEAAGARGEQPMWRVGRQAAICSHEVQPGDRFKGTEQDAAGEPFGFATDVHAEMKAVDLVDIRMPGGAEEHRVSRRWSAMRVGGRVWLLVVRTEISLDFDDASGYDPGGSAMDEQFSEQLGSDALGGVLKKAAGHEPAGEASRADDRSAGYLCVLFHSLIWASTSSAWPSGVTLGKMCSRVWSGPMRKVVRSIPQTFLPYMFFSFITPN